MNQFQRWWSRAVDRVEPDSAAGKHDGRDWQEKHEGRNANEIVGAAIARAVLARSPSRREQSIASAAVHFGFGAAMGAAYGALAERDGGGGVMAGAAWGAAMWLVADEVAMPLLGLADSEAEYSVDSHLQSLTAHLVYGAVTGSLQRTLRSRV
jgi:hypothetical protein